MIILSIISFALDIITTEIGLAHGAHELGAAYEFYTMGRPLAYLYGIAPWLTLTVFISIGYMLINKGRLNRILDTPKFRNDVLWICVVALIGVTVVFAVGHLDAGIDNLIYLIQNGLL